MPDNKTNTPTEDAVSTGSGSDRVMSKERGTDATKSAAVTPAKVDDAATSKANGTKPSPDPTTVTTTQSPAKRSLSLKKLIPVFVLALAALILFGIIGGWNRWVGSG